MKAYYLKRRSPSAISLIDENSDTRINGWFNPVVIEVPDNFDFEYHRGKAFEKEIEDMIDDDGIFPPPYTEDKAEKYFKELGINIPDSQLENLFLKVITRQMRSLC